MSRLDRGAGDRSPASGPSGQEGWRLSIQAGRADEMRAEIGVVVRHEQPAVDNLRLSGAVTGPTRGRDVTLPTTVRLVGMPEVSRPDLAAGRAVFTEPAYWSPELPNLYRLSAEVRAESGDAVIATFDRLVGLRRLGVRGRSFWLEGRRWVPRGVECVGGEFDPAVFRSAHAVAVIDDPAEEVCAVADRTGVAIIARLAADAHANADAAARAVARWSLHPSVVLVVVPHGACSPVLVAAVRPKQSTLLVAAEVDGTAAPTAVPTKLIESLDCLLVDLPEGGLPHEAWRHAAPEMPLVARRICRLADEDSAQGVAAARLACDSLQAALAAWGCAKGSAGLGWDWAGYVATLARGAGTV